MRETIVQRRIDEIKNVITIEDAREWQADQEKFVFCIDALDISASAPYADETVNELEEIFEAMLAEDEE